jgi:hypothetical protein
MRRIVVKAWIGLALLMLAAFRALAAGSSPLPPAAANKMVHVRQYKRKDGTVVHSYTRSAPGSRSVASSHAGKQIGSHKASPTASGKPGTTGRSAGGAKPGRGNKANGVSP